MQKFFVVIFSTSIEGKIAGPVPGYKNFWALLHRDDKTDIKPNHRYLVAVDFRPPGNRYCFVSVVKEINELYHELEALLLAAKWERVSEIFDDPSTTVMHPTLGEVKAKFIHRRGKVALHQYVEARMRVGDFDTPAYTFTIGQSEIKFSLLASHVLKQCGSGQYRHKPVAKSA